MNFEFSRMDILNYIIEKHGFKRYLEIGTYQDACFNAIVVETKVTGVDDVVRTSLLCELVQRLKISCIA